MTDLVNDNGAFQTCVVGNLANRFFNSTADDHHAGLFIADCFHFVQHSLSFQQCGSAAGYDAFRNGCAGRVQSVFNAQFLFFQFYFGSRADFDYGNTAGQFCQAFLQFFLIKLGRGFRNLGFNLFYTGFDFRFLAAAVHDGGQFFAYANLACAAQVFHGSAVQFAAHFFTDYGSAGEDSNILQHGFAAVAEAGSLNSHSLEGAAQFVYN